MGKGRKPIPTKIKRLRGNPGKRPLPKGEPEYSRDDSCPEWLDDIAKAVWMRVAGELAGAGLLDSANRDLLAAFCDSVSVVRQAAAEVAKGGIILGEADGPQKLNPAIAAGEKAKATMAKLGAAFGLGPADRAKIAKGGEKRDDLEDFLQKKRTG